MSHIFINYNILMAFTMNRKKELEREFGSLNLGKFFWLGAKALLEVDLVKIWSQ